MAQEYIVRFYSCNIHEFMCRELFLDRYNETLIVLEKGCQDMRKTYFLIVYTHVFLKNMYIFSYININEDLHNTFPP